MKKLMITMIIAIMTMMIGCTRDKSTGNQVNDLLYRVECNDDITVIYNEL